ncbi:MAG: CARDB domain-containing protein, partial [Archaeoglobaceae archaeon]
LKASESTSAEIQWTPSSTGSYTIKVVADSDDDVLESNEANNENSTIVTVVAPDLTVPGISVLVDSSEVNQIVLGQTARINATIENTGNSDAGKFNVSFFVNDNLLEKVTIEGLKASESTSAEIQWTPSSTGSYTIKVVADSDDDVLESNEANNESYIAVEVVAPTPTTPPTTPPKTTPRPILGGGAGGGGAMPGVPVYITAYITVKANEESIIDLPQSAFWETNVVALLILSSEDNNIRFRIEKLKELPSGIPEPKGDLVVLILSIEPTLSKEASIKGKIKFGIPIEDIKAKGFDPNAVAVVLLKWNGKEWIELPTKFVGSDGKYSYYEAETTSFSYFVAQLKPLETPKPTTPVATPPTTLVTTPTTTPAEKPFIPGFEAIFAIAGLLAVAYLLRRKKY